MANIVTPAGTYLATDGSIHPEIGTVYIVGTNFGGNISIDSTHATLDSASATAFAIATNGDQEPNAVWACQSEPWGWQVVSTSGGYSGVAIVLDTLDDDTTGETTGKGVA